MKTTQIPWTSACLTFALFASGCSTSRHGLTQTYRPAVASDSIASRELPATSNADSRSDSNDSGSASPQNAANSDGLDQLNSNNILPVGFEVQEPLAVRSAAAADDGSTQAEQPMVDSESIGWSLAQLEATALQQNPAILQASASAQKHTVIATRSDSNQIPLLATRVNSWLTVGRISILRSLNKILSWETNSGRINRY